MPQGSSSSCECVLVRVRVPSARCLGGGRCMGGPCSWVLRGLWCVRMAQHGMRMRSGPGLGARGCRGSDGCEGMGTGMGTGMGRQGGACRRHAQLGMAAGQTASLAQPATRVWRTLPAAGAPKISWVYGLSWRRSLLSITLHGVVGRAIGSTTIGRGFETC